MSARMFPVPGRHDGKVYVVTGGAQGIGRACAERFVQEGAKVVIADIDEAGEDVAGSIGAAFEHTDMSDPDAVRALASATVDRFGRIDALVNNTGHGPKGEVRELSDADRRLSMDDCLLRADQGARIINGMPGFIDSLPIKPERVARVPAGRYAQVRDLSRVVAFPASNAARYITGQNIRVDGGLTRSV